MVYIQSETTTDEKSRNDKTIIEELRELRDKVDKLEEKMKKHSHNPEDDNITPITRTIDLDASEAFRVAKAGGVSGEELKAGIYTAQRAAMFAGVESAVLADGNDVSTIILEHQGYTTGSLNWTFFYGYRPPAYGGAGKVVTPTKIKVTSVDLKVNELAGVQLMLGVNNQGYTEFFTIESNTRNTITFDGSSSLTGDVFWFTYTPIYLGSANFPWRRAYLTEDIRFGYGPSSGAGVVFIKYGTGSPENAVTANVGSLYLRRDGGTNTTLYVKESGTGNTGWAAI